MLEEMLGKSKNKKPIMAVGILLAVLFIAWNTLFRPLLSNIKNIQMSKLELGQKESIFKNIVETEKKMLRYKSFLVQSADRTTLIGELNSLAVKSSLTINSIIPEEQAGYSQGVDFEKMFLRIEAVGDYHALGQFVSQVENLERFAKIVRLEMGANDISDLSGPTATTLVAPDRNRLHKISLAVGFLYAPREIA